MKTSKHCSDIRILLVAFFVFCSCKYSFGQVTLDGFLTDSIKSPISFALVSIKSIKSGKVVEFTNTDEKGFYMFAELDTGEYILFISHISYFSDSLKVKFKSSNKYSQHVVLKYKTTYLNEISIIDKSPISTKGDTIEISTKDFTNGSEKVVEDVLKKLPGINIQRDGTIYVNGKPIEKILIDGDDLVSKSYKVISKNLTADLIESVEILNNFNDNPLFKGFDPDEKVAINIKLNSKRKRKIFGDVSQNIGTNRFFESKANLISLLNNTKFYSISNFNNIGNASSNTFNAIAENKASYRFNNNLGAGEATDLLINPTMRFTSIPDEYYRFNNSAFSSLNAVNSISKKTNVLSHFIYSNEKINVIKNEEQSFKLSSGNFNNIENLNLDSKIRTLYGSVTLLSNINKTTRFSLNTKLTNTDNDFTSRGNLNQLTSKEKLETKLNLFTSDAELTNKLSKHEILNFKVKYINDSRPQNLDFNPYLGNFSSLFAPEISPDSISQIVRGKLNFVGFDGQYQYKKESLDVSINVGFSHKESSYNTFLSFFKDQLIVPPSENNLNNNLEYKLENFWIKSRASYSFKKLVFTGVLQPVISKFENHSSMIPSKIKVRVLPTIRIDAPIKEKQKLILIYSRGLQNLTGDVLLDKYNVVNQSTLSRGINEFEQLTSNSILAEYSLGGWTEQSLFNASIYYSIEENYLTSNTQVYRTYQARESIVFNDRTNASINFSYDQYISALSINLKLLGNYNFSNFENVVNNEIRVIDTQSNSMGFEVRSLFSNYFEFHLGLIREYTRFNVNDKQSNTFSYYEGFSDINFSINDKTQIRFTNEVFLFPSRVNTENYILSNFEIARKYSNPDINLRFQLKNIFNYNQYRSLQATDIFESRLALKMFPRIFSVTIDFRF